MAVMSAEQAIEFDYYSEENASFLEDTAQENGCSCRAYQDWFTYARWQALGFQVRKGEHGSKIRTFAPITKKDDEGENKIVGKRPWITTVFCRCQVEKKDELRQ